jgi:toxin YoeB
MRLVFDLKALENLRHWTETDRRKATKIAGVIRSNPKIPFEGIGKPEPLKFELLVPPHRPGTPAGL